MTKRTSRFAVHVLLPATLATACFSERVAGPDGGGAQCDGTTTACAVTVQDNSFSPSTRRVTAGSTVRWTNQGASPHTSTSLVDVWDSGNLNGGQSFEHTFDSAGEFEYECVYHDGMTGTIVVE